jgi:hypothetical protein
MSSDDLKDWINFRMQQRQLEELQRIRWQNMTPAERQAHNDAVARSEAQAEQDAQGCFRVLAVVGLVGCGLSVWWVYGEGIVKTVSLPQFVGCGLLVWWICKAIIRRN